MCFMATYTVRQTSPPHGVIPARHLVLRTRAANWANALILLGNSTGSWLLAAGQTSAKHTSRQTKLHQNQSCSSVLDGVSHDELFLPEVAAQSLAPNSEEGQPD
jgi:hypothetical protein